MISERALALALALLGACTRYEAGLALELGLEVRAPSPAWRLARGHVALGWVELGECPELSLRELWIGTAHAHQAGTPTRLGEPLVVDLTRSATIALGVLEPPPGRYCSAHLALAPADEDAKGLVAGMLGRTLRLQGAWSASATIAVDSAAFREGQVALEAPLSIDEGAPRGVLRVSIGGASWPVEGLAAEGLLERLISTATAR